MQSAFSRLWTGLKATLAIGLLAAGSLYSAKIVDRKGVNPFTAALVEPTTTGSIKPSRALNPLRMPLNGPGPF
jgi:hypothetical protein